MCVTCVTPSLLSAALACKPNVFGIDLGIPVSIFRVNYLQYQSVTVGNFVVQSVWCCQALSLIDLYIDECKGRSADC